MSASSADLMYGPVAGTSERVNKAYGFVKIGEILDELREC